MTLICTIDMSHFKMPIALAPAKAGIKKAIQEALKKYPDCSVTQMPAGFLIKFPGTDKSIAKFKAVMWALNKSYAPVGLKISFEEQVKTVDSNGK